MNWQNTTEFLRRVLPDQGYYCATTIIETRRYNRFFGSIDDLARHIQAEDQAGRTVYHACASFVVPKNNPSNAPRGERKLGRTAHNVAWVKSFWLDIDAGEGKPYRDQREAVIAVLAFCRVAELPEPLFVFSGYGVHVYWVLGANCEPAVWWRCAAGLKVLCLRGGLRADSKRTSDMVSILRTPGTFNRKQIPWREVTCGPLTGPYQLDQFKGLLDEKASATVQRSVRNVAPVSSLFQKEKPAYLNGHHHEIAVHVPETFTDTPAYASPIADECAQIGALREKQGGIPEPHWYNALGVLAHCADGEKMAHAWSSPDPRYKEEDTNERLARWRTIGPTTCKVLDDVNPGVCEGCKHWGQIGSPIALGRVQETRSVADARPLPQLPALASQPIILPSLPPDYGWTNDHALVLKSSNRTGDVNILISSYPIFLDRVNTGEIKGEFSLSFKQFIPEKGWFDIAIAARDLFSAAGGSLLADRGANIHDHPHFLRYARHAVDMFYREGKITMRADQFGWKDDDTSFLFGTNLYSMSGVTPISGSDEINYRSKYVGPAKNGSLEGWKRCANALFASGCEAQSLALLASFAAPLMRFQSHDEGGAIISLVTHKTGTGKSTALAGAASVWGDREGLGLTTGDTKVTKFLSLGAIGNLPMIYDEIQSRDPEAIREFVVNFTNGRDRMRATRSGEIKHTAATWQTILISASNGSLVDALSTASKADAPAARILEVHLVVPPGLKHALGDKLKEELLRNHGYAGDAYLCWLTVPENLAWAKAALEKATADVWEKTKLKPDYRFWVRTTGAIVVAAVIVKQLDLVQFSVDRIVQWLLQRIMPVNAREVDDDLWAVEALGQFLNEHTDSTITMPGPFRPGERNVPPIIHPRRRLVVRYEVKGQKLLVASAPLMEWLVKHEMSYREFREQLSFRGVMTRERVLATLAAGTDYASSRVVCVELDAAHEQITGYKPKLPGEENIIPLRSKEAAVPHAR